MAVQHYLRIKWVLALVVLVTAEVGSNLTEGIPKINENGPLVNTDAAEKISISDIKYQPAEVSLADTNAKTPITENHNQETTQTSKIPSEREEDVDPDTNCTTLAKSVTWSSKFLNMDVCSCTSAGLAADCTCTSRSGILQTTDITGSANDITYTIDISEPAITNIIFAKEDVALQRSLCEITIGDKVFLEAAAIDDIVQATTTDGIVSISGYVPSFCTYEIRYFAYPLALSENATIIMVNETEGVLTPPEDDLGFFQYQPFTQILWVFRPDVPISNFNFSFDYIDLNSPSPHIHEENANWTSADFLLIGSGERLLQGNDQMYFGNYETPPLNLLSVGGESHVFFNSFLPVFNASGFNISFVATEVESTSTPSPTTTENPPAPEQLETTYIASVNMARTNASYINNTIHFFQEAMANMATEYLQLQGIKTKDPITYSTVEVYSVLTCNPFKCDEVCMAFNFSIACVNEFDGWIFTSVVIQDMLFNSEVKIDFSLIGDNCKICDEKSEMNLWLYIPIPIVIVLFAVGISMAQWYMGGKNKMEESRKKYEQEIADRHDDNRRRSSGDVSMLGLGGSIASRGSLNSRRFTMPFPKANKEEDIEEEDSIDMSGFKEYDPDLGRIDPTEFGISREFLSDQRAVAHYSNSGYVDDEEDERAIFRRPPAASVNTAGTDSEDSDDDGGAVTFAGTSVKMNRISSPLKSALKPMTTFVDVHTIEESGETAL